MARNGNGSGNGRRRPTILEESLFEEILCFSQFLFPKCNLQKLTLILFWRGRFGFVAYWLKEFKFLFSPFFFTIYPFFELISTHFSPFHKHNFPGCVFTIFPIFLNNFTQIFPTIFIFFKRKQKLRRYVQQKPMTTSSSSSTKPMMTTEEGKL